MSVHLDATLHCTTTFGEAERFQRLVGRRWEATGLIWAEQRRLCLFFMTDLWSLPFLPDFRNFPVCPMKPFTGLVGVKCLSRRTCNLFNWGTSYFSGASLKFQPATELRRVNPRILFFNPVGEEPKIRIYKVLIIYGQPNRLNIGIRPFNSVFAMGRYVNVCPRHHLDDALLILEFQFCSPL